MAVALPALIGLVGLAIDGTRLATRDAELASLTDAAALAAAHRLDLGPDAIPAARAAAVALVAQDEGRDGADRLRLRFAESLDQLRQDPGFSLGDESGPAALYVEASLAGRSPELSFLALVGAAPVTLTRKAVAESRYYACDVTPAALCHADPDAFAATARPGRQFLLRVDGNRLQGSVVPLDRSDAVGPRQAIVNLAQDAPRFCYADGIRLRTNVPPAQIDEAVNVRFDRYVGDSGPVGPDLAVFPPAPNVIQGRRLQSCASPPRGGEIYPPYRLPRDTAFSGLVLSGRWDGGAGDWKTAPPFGGTGVAFRSAVDEYVGWNHGDKSPAVQDRLRSSRTRYELYLRELGLDSGRDDEPVDTRSLGPSTATMPTGGPRAGPLAVRSESPVPICYAGPGRPIQPRRRVLYLSVVDCGGFPAAATAENLSRRVAKFFLTEPSEQGALLAEFVGMVTPTASDGKLRHVVQLVDTR